RLRRRLRGARIRRTTPVLGDPAAALFLERAFESRERRPVRALSLPVPTDRAIVRLHPGVLRLGRGTSKRRGELFLPRHSPPRCRKQANVANLYERDGRLMGEPSPLSPAETSGPIIPEGRPTPERIGGRRDACSARRSGAILSPIGRPSA